MTRSHHLLSILFIIALSIAVYSNTLKNDFVFDDDLTITNNILIKDLGNLSKLFSKDYFPLSREVTYRPVVTFSYFIDYALYGHNPWGFHLTNILIHAINGALLYILLTFLYMPSRHIYDNSGRGILLPALMVSLLWATHPVLTEAVNAISFREDLLAFFFFFITLNIYIALQRNKISTLQRSMYLLSCITYFLALLSKEMSATLPLIIYCYERICTDKHKKSNYNIGYGVITLIYAYIRFYHFYNPREGDFSAWHLTERILTVPWLFYNYLKLITFPASLSADYAILPVTSIFSVAFVIPLFAVIAILAMAIIFRKRKRVMVFGIFFFIISLMPVYNIIPLRNPLAERYLYLPLTGFLIALYGLIKPMGYAKRSGTVLILICSLLLIGMFCIMAIKRNRIWSSNYSLWADAVKKAPRSSRAHSNLGSVFLKQGQLDEAVKELKLAINVSPNFAEVHNNLGYAYYLQKRFEPALLELRSAVGLKPDYAEAHMSLGMVYFETERLDEAISEFKEVTRLSPESHNAYNNQGTVYETLKMLDEAESAYLTAVNLKPGDYRYRYNLAKLYMKKGKIAEARRELGEALRLKPDLLPAVRELEMLNK